MWKIGNFKFQISNNNYNISIFESSQRNKIYTNMNSNKRSPGAHENPTAAANGDQMKQSLINLIHANETPGAISGDMRDSGALGSNRPVKQSMRSRGTQGKGQHSQKPRIGSRYDTQRSDDSREVEFDHFKGQRAEDEEERLPMAVAVAGQVARQNQMKHVLVHKREQGKISGPRDFGGAGRVAKDLILQQTNANGADPAWKSVAAGQILRNSERVASPLMFPKHIKTEKTTGAKTRFQNTNRAEKQNPDQISKSLNRHYQRKIQNPQEPPKEKDSLLHQIKMETIYTQKLLKSSHERQNLQMAPPAITRTTFQSKKASLNSMYHSASPNRPTTTLNLADQMLRNSELFKSSNQNVPKMKILDQSEGPGNMLGEVGQRKAAVVPDVIGGPELVYQASLTRGRATPLVDKQEKSPEQRLGKKFECKRPVTNSTFRNDQSALVQIDKIYNNQKSLQNLLGETNDKFGHRSSLKSNLHSTLTHQDLRRSQSRYLKGPGAAHAAAGGVNKKQRSLQPMGPGQAAAQVMRTSSQNRQSNSKAGNGRNTCPQNATSIGQYKMRNNKTTQNLFATIGQQQDFFSKRHESQNPQQQATTLAQYSCLTSLQGSQELKKPLKPFGSKNQNTKNRNIQYLRQQVGGSSCQRYQNNQASRIPLKPTQSNLQKTLQNTLGNSNNMLHILNIKAYANKTMARPAGGQGRHHNQTQPVTSHHTFRKSQHPNADQNDQMLRQLHRGLQTEKESVNSNDTSSQGNGIINLKYQTANPKTTEFKRKVIKNHKKMNIKEFETLMQQQNTNQSFQSAMVSYSRSAAALPKPVQQASQSRSLNRFAQSKGSLPLKKWKHSITPMLQNVDKREAGSNEKLPPVAYFPQSRDSAKNTDDGYERAESRYFNNHILNMSQLANSFSTSRDSKNPTVQQTRFQPSESQSAERIDFTNLLLGTGTAGTGRSSIPAAQPIRDEIDRNQFQNELILMESSARFSNQSSVETNARLLAEPTNSLYIENSTYRYQQNIHDEEAAGIRMANAMPEPTPDIRPNGHPDGGVAGMVKDKDIGCMAKQETEKSPFGAADEYEIPKAASNDNILSPPAARETLNADDADQNTAIKMRNPKDLGQNRNNLSAKIDQDLQSQIPQGDNPIQIFNCENNELVLKSTSNPGESVKPGIEDGGTRKSSVDKSSAAADEEAEGDDGRRKQYPSPGVRDSPRLEDAEVDNGRSQRRSEQEESRFSNDERVSESKSSQNSKLQNHRSKSSKQLLQINTAEQEPNTLSKPQTTHPVNAPSIPSHKDHSTLQHFKPSNTKSPKPQKFNFDFVSDTGNTPNGAPQQLEKNDALGTDMDPVKLYYQSKNQEQVDLGKLLRSGKLSSGAAGQVSVSNSYGGQEDAEAIEDCSELVKAAEQQSDGGQGSCGDNQNDLIGDIDQKEKQLQSHHGSRSSAARDLAAVNQSQVVQNGAAHVQMDLEKQGAEIKHAAEKNGIANSRIQPNQNHEILTLGKSVQQNSQQMDENDQKLEVQQLQEFPLTQMLAKGTSGGKSGKITKISRKVALNDIPQQKYEELEESRCFQPVFLEQIVEEDRLGQRPQVGGSGDLVALMAFNDAFSRNEQKDRDLDFSTPRHLGSSSRYNNHGSDAPDTNNSDDHAHGQISSKSKSPDRNASQINLNMSKIPGKTAESTEPLKLQISEPQPIESDELPKALNVVDNINRSLETLRKETMIPTQLIMLPALEASRADTGQEKAREDLSKIQGNAKSSQNREVFVDKVKFLNQIDGLDMDQMPEPGVAGASSLNQELNLSCCLNSKQDHFHNILVQNNKDIMQKLYKQNNSPSRAQPPRHSIEQASSNLESTPIMTQNETITLSSEGKGRFLSGISSDAIDNAAGRIPSIDLSKSKSSVEVRDTASDYSDAHLYDHQPRARAARHKRSNANVSSSGKSGNIDETDIVIPTTLPSKIDHKYHTELKRGEDFRGAGASSLPAEGSSSFSDANATNSEASSATAQSNPTSSASYTSELSRKISQDLKLAHQHIGNQKLVDLIEEFKSQRVNDSVAMIKRQGVMRVPGDPGEDLRDKANAAIQLLKNRQGLFSKLNFDYYQ